jgi:carboxypeptidase family protein/TonB-dependent receptor-like protein
MYAGACRKETSMTTRTLPQGRSLRVLVCALMLAIAAASALKAQNTGTILGTVKDQSGAVLPGAQVTVKNIETGIARNSVSGPRGEYRIPALPVGTYDVETTMAGFQTGVRKGIELSLGREAVIDFSLSVGAVTEQVTVTGEAPAIETTTAMVSGLVDPKQMMTIPLNARSFIDLVPTQGFAVFADSGETSATKGFGRKISITGARYNQNSFLLDGADINDATSSAGSAANTLAGVETVREFRVITNAYDAQYGKHTGGVISAITKSGTNQFHGSIFEYFRNIAMDAARWEDNAFPTGPNRTSQKPPFRRNQFGGSLGGPVIKDKTFFFGSYEGLRQQLASTNIYNTIGDAARAGLYKSTICDPSTGTKTAVNCVINPIVKPYVDVYPKANLPCVASCLGSSALGIGSPNDQTNGAARYSVAQNAPTNENYVNVRGDHTLNEKNSFFGRFNMDKADSFAPSFNTGAQSKTQSMFSTVKDTHIFSPTLLSETLISYNRTRIDLFDVNLPGMELPKFNFSDDPTTPGSIAVTNLNSLGGSNTNPKAYVQNVFQYGEDISLSHGAHSMKFGGQFERIQFNQQHNPFYLPGEFDFTSVPEFLIKTVSAAHFIKPGSTDIRGFRENVTGLYFQDDINVRPGLTVNLGLRYEFISVPKEVNGLLATVRDTRPEHFYSINDTQTDVGDPYFLNPSLKNFAPRVGFAWTPFKSGKLAIRGGAGLFHDQILPTYYQTAGARIPPYFAVAEMFQQSILGAQQDLGLPQTGIDFPNAFVTQRNLLTQNIGSKPQLDGFQFYVDQPAVYKWSFSLQDELWGGTTLEAGYTGTRGTHLVRGNINLNSTPGQIINDQQFIIFDKDRIVYNNNMGRMRWRFTDGDSFYHGMNLSLKKRFSGGFQVQSSYTWSRSIDDSSTFTGGTDLGSADRTAYLGKHEKGLSGFDVTQSFFTNGTYDLPGQRLGGIMGQVLGGWSVSGNLRLSSGNPVNLSAQLPQVSITVPNPTPPPATVSQTLATTNVDGATLNLIPGGTLNPVSGRSAGCSQTISGVTTTIPAGTKLGTPDMYYDVCQFAYLQTCLTATACPQTNGLLGFFQGNVGRNVLRTPGVASLDATVSKTTKVKWLGEAGAVEFHAEFYNLLNRPNFGIPSLSVFSRTGAWQSAAVSQQITSTRSNSRQIQLALRVQF